MIVEHYSSFECVWLIDTPDEHLRLWEVNFAVQACNLELIKLGFKRYDTVTVLTKNIVFFSGICDHGG